MDQFNSSTKKQITTFNPLSKNQEKPLGNKGKATNIKIKNEDLKNETSHRTKGLNLLGNLSFVPESSRKRKQNCMELNEPEKRIKIEENTNNNSDNEEEKVFNYMTGVYEPVKKKSIESPKNKDKTQEVSKEIKEELVLSENGLHHPTQSRTSLSQVPNNSPFKRNLFILLTNENNSPLVQQRNESLVLGKAKDNSICSLNHSQETPIKILQKSMDISPDKGEYFNNSNNSVNLSSEHLKLDDTLDESSTQSINFIHSTPEKLNLDATPDILPDNSEPEHSNYSINIIHSAPKQLTPEKLSLDATPDILPDNSEPEHSNHSINIIHSAPKQLNLNPKLEISPDNNKNFNHSINSVHLPPEHLNLGATPAILSDNGEEDSNHSINSVHSPLEHLNLEAVPDISSDNEEHSNHSINSVYLPQEHLNLEAAPDISPDNEEHSNHSDTSVTLPPEHFNLLDTSEILPGNGENSNHSINSVHSPLEHLNVEATPDISPDSEEHSNHSLTSVTLPPEHLNLDDTSEIVSDNEEHSQVNSNLDNISDILSDNGDNSNHSNNSNITPPENLNVDDTSDILPDNDEHSNHLITSVNLLPEHVNSDHNTKKKVLRDFLSNKITKESYLNSNKPFQGLQSVSETNLSDSNENSNDSIDDLPSENVSSAHCSTSDANITLKDSSSYINESETINVEVTILNKDKVLPDRQDLVENCSANNSQKQQFLTKWRCKTCGLDAGTKVQLISHLYDAHLKEDYEIKIKCKSCTFESSTPEEMKVHKLSHEKNDYVRNKVATVAGPSKNNTLLKYGFSFNCNSCKYNCDTPEEMAKHRLGHEKTVIDKNGPSENFALIYRNLKVTCNICKFKCDTLKELEVHRLSHDKTACSNNTNSIISIIDSDNDSDDADDDNHDDNFNYHKSQQFRCFICNNYQTDNLTNIKFHAGTKHDVEYNCDDHFWKTPLKTCPKCIFENIKKGADAAMLICKRCGYKTIRSTHFNRHKEKKGSCQQYLKRYKEKKASFQQYLKRHKALKSPVVAVSGNSEKLLENPLLNKFQCCDCPIGFTEKNDLQIHAMSNHPNSTYKCPLHNSKVNFIKCEKCIYELLFKKCDPINTYEDRSVSKRKRLATEINKSAYHEPQEYTFTDSDSDPCEENETEVAVTRSRALGNKSNTNQTEKVITRSLRNKSSINPSNIETEKVIARSLRNKSNINPSNIETEKVIARSPGNKSNINPSNNQTEKIIARSLGNKSNNNPAVGSNKLLIVTIINTVPSSAGLTTTDNANTARSLTTDPDEVIVIDDSEENISQINPKKTPADVNTKSKAQCFDCKYSSADRDQNFLDHVCRHIGSKYQCVKHFKRKFKDCIKCFYEETLKNVRHNCKLCQKCGFAAADFSSLKIHQDHTDSCKEWSDQNLKSGEIKCLGCNYITTHKKFLKYHMVDHLSVIFSCDVHPNGQNESCNKCINRSCLDDAKKEAKICKKCNFKTVIQQVFERHNCKETGDHSFVSVLEQNNFEVIIVDECEDNIPVDKACDQSQKNSGKSIVTEKSVEKSIIDNITMENTNSTIEVISKEKPIEISETNYSDETVLTDVHKAITPTPVVGNIMVEKIRTEDNGITVESMTDEFAYMSSESVKEKTPFVKIVDQSVKINDPSATINDPYVKQIDQPGEINDQSVKINDPSVDINDRSVKPNDQSVKINDQSVKINDPSATINDPYVKQIDQSGKINDQSVKISDLSIKINDPSVKPNDQFVKINVQSVKINKPSVDTNGPFVMPNDQSVKINDQSVKINDPSVDINDRSVKPNDQFVKVNDQSVKINDPSATINDPYVKQIDQSGKINDQSVKISDLLIKINDPSVKPNDQFVKINVQSVKINKPSVDTNGPFVMPNDQSVNIKHLSININDQSLNINDQSVKINDQSVKINDPSLDINDPSIKPNEQPVKINDQSVKINDPSLKTNDQSPNIKVLSVKINDPSVKINYQSVKKYNCFDCDSFVTHSLEELKKHAMSQHKSSNFKCNEHSSGSDFNNCLKCIYEYGFLSQKKIGEHETESVESETTRMSTLVSGENEENSKFDHSQTVGSGNSIVSEEIKAKCYDCKFTAKKKGFRFKEHVSQHVGSKYQCLEHWKNKNFDCLKCYYEETLQTLNIEVKICRYCGYRAMNALSLKTHLNNPGTCTRWANRKLEAGHIRCFKCFFVTSKKQYLKYHMIDHYLNWMFSCDLHREKKNDGCEKCINEECLEMAKKEAKFCKKCNFKTVIKQVFKIHECIAKNGGLKEGFSGTTPSLTPVFSIKVLPGSFLSSENVVKTPQLDKTMDPPLVTKENISFGSTQQTNNMNNTIIDLKGENDEQQNKSVMQKKSYRCFDCDFSHNEKECLISHARVGHVNSNFKCDEHEKSYVERCDKCFYWIILQEMPGSKLCYDCCPPKAFRGGWEIRRHINRFHKNSDFKCEEHPLSCAEGCDKCSYWQQLQKLSPSKRCYDCRSPKMFYDNWSLQRHIKRIHKDSAYVCNIHKRQKLECGRCHYQSLVHKKSIITKRKYRCFDCDFSHSNKSFLYSHAFKHKNSEFKCDKHNIFSTEYCNKCFYWHVLQRLSKLKRCFDCRPPKAFVDTWHLQRHVLNHKKSVYVCKRHNGQNDKCDKCFYQLMIRGVHINGLFSCCECDHTNYKEKQNLLKHIRKCHLNSSFECDMHTLSQKSPKCRKCIYVAAVEEAGYMFFDSE